MSLFSLGKDANIMSIDLGFRNIKVVEVDVGKNDFIYLKNYGIVPTPRDCIKNGYIKDISKMGQVIRRVIDDNGIKSKNTKVVLSGTHIVSRLIGLHVVPGQDTDSLVNQAAVKYLPAVSLDTHEIDYRIIDTFDREGKKYCKIFVTAILKSIIKSYLDVLIELDLNPLAVEIPSYSIDKFFKRNIKQLDDKYKDEFRVEPGQEDAFAVIDFGSETTILNILRNKVLEFNKAILRGSSNMDELISKVLFRKLSEAEAIKQRYGLLVPESFTDEERLSIQNAILYVLRETVAEIQRCFEFYKQKCGGPKINRIYIIGGGSMLQGLREFLMKTLNIPVFPIGLLSIENIHINESLDVDKINYLINATGITLK